MLNDLFGYFKRNSKNMNKFQVKQALKEIKQIQLMLEKELKLKEAV